MTISILGRSIEVVIIPSQDLDKMAEHEALGMFKDDKIYLSIALKPEERDRVLKHEVMHALLTISGLTNLLDEKVEEALCDLTENFPKL